jgi:hypothetical protein
MNRSRARLSGPDGPFGTAGDLVSLDHKANPRIIASLATDPQGQSSTAGPRIRHAEE